MKQSSHIHRRNKNHLLGTSSHHQPSAKLLCARQSTKNKKRFSKLSHKRCECWSYLEGNHVDCGDLVYLCVVKGANDLGVLNDSEIVDAKDIHDANDAVDWSRGDTPRSLND